MDLTERLPELDKLELQERELLIQKDKIIDEINKIKQKKNKILDYSNQNDLEPIFISTTNEMESEYFINEIAIREDIISFYASCSFNAVMGRVFRVISDETHCFHCVGLEIQDSKDSVKFPDFKEDHSPYQDGIPGIGVDVSIIGSFTAKFIIESIMDEIEINHNYRNIQSDHFIINLKGEEKLGIGLIKQKFRKRKDCPICNTIKRSYENRQKVLNLINDLKNDENSD